MAYRSNVKGRLEQHVQTLDQLNSALHLLEELRDMENKIDDVYLPIETMYDKLRYVVPVWSFCFFFSVTATLHVFLFNNNNEIFMRRESLAQK